MPRSARIFITLVSLAGFLAGAITLASAKWRPAHAFEFVVYLVMAALSSRLKVKLP